MIKKVSKLSYMTDQKEIILKAIIYEIVIAAGEEGTKALLTADNLLADMAVPVTQYDFTYADRAKMKKLFRAVEHFLLPEIIKDESKQLYQGWASG